MISEDEKLAILRDLKRAQVAFQLESIKTAFGIPQGQARTPKPLAPIIGQ